MNIQQLNETLVYLDRAFIADWYEGHEGRPVASSISSVQGKKAGVSLLPFSGELNAQETRTYSVSTTGMLAETWSGLREKELLQVSDLQSLKSSRFAWFKGNLSTLRVVSSGEAESEVFVLRGPRQGEHLDLIAVTSYFTSGFAELLPLQKTLLSKMNLPAYVFARVLPAQDHQSNWLAVPLVILEATRMVDGELSQHQNASVIAVKST